MTIDKFLNWVLLCASLCSCSAVGSQQVLIEAESFTKMGGWVIDQQSMDQMGSPYVMAHGLGQIVEDASKEVIIPAAGVYKLWVRTRDWVGQWKGSQVRAGMRAVGSPGQFKVSINGKPLKQVFGMEGAAWHWQDGGSVILKKGKQSLVLHDLTGFNGRCDAIFLTTDKGFIPPNDLPSLMLLRKNLLGDIYTPQEKGHYDFVVVGGGTAGICAAISAARQGCKVAFFQDRPVLGGNNSSEVRVGLSGLIRQKPYPNLGNLVDEIDPVGHWTLWDANKKPNLPRSKQVFSIINKHPEKKQHNAGPASNYDDNRKLQAVLREKNITLFLNTRVNGVEMKKGKIAAVIGQNIKSGKKIRVSGALFADCTGDGNLGALAKADFREGRESREETGERLAPAKPDELVMGTSVQWNSKAEKKVMDFPLCPWAIQFDEKTCIKTTRGDWDWETGANQNHVTEIEAIRDYALRVTFGNWSVLKNYPKFKKQFARRSLSWVAYIGGKRESRRLLGDVLLKQQDIVKAIRYKDACVTTTWTIDLHYSKKAKCACDAFQSEVHHLEIKPYPIPFRCLYSRNVPNMMMAGRNISVTHVALGTVRVMRTTGMMGEVLGMAAGLSKKHGCNPREIYQQHLEELKQLMETGVPKIGEQQSK